MGSFRGLPTSPPFPYHRCSTWDRALTRTTPSKSPNRAISRYRHAPVDMKVFLSSCSLAWFPAGWPAKLSRAPTLALLATFVIGVVGTFIGGWLLPQLNIHLGAGT